jgi:hypothetical protein
VYSAALALAMPPGILRSLQPLLRLLLLAATFWQTVSPALPPDCTRAMAGAPPCPQRSAPHIVGTSLLSLGACDECSIRAGLRAGCSQTDVRAYCSGDGDGGEHSSGAPPVQHLARSRTLVGQDFAAGRPVGKPGSSMTAAQLGFAASHYVGSQKLFLPETQVLRALNPDFIMLHYHLGIWQTAYNHPLIINGTGANKSSPRYCLHDATHDCAARSCLSAGRCAWQPGATTTHW